MLEENEGTIGNTEDECEHETIYGGLCVQCAKHVETLSDDHVKVAYFNKALYGNIPPPSFSNFSSLLLSY